MGTNMGLNYRATNMWGSSGFKFVGYTDSRILTVDDVVKGKVDDQKFVRFAKGRLLQLSPIINCACNEFRSWEVGFVSLRFSQDCVLRNIKLTGNGEYDVLGH